MFGLLNKSKVSIFFDVENYKVTDIKGVNPSEITITIPDTKVFSMPSHLLINGEPLFPTKYEILNNGRVVYCSKIVPAFRLYIEDDNFLNFRAKEKKYTVTPRELSSLPTLKRKRHPSQNQIMGESASEHAKKSINNGILKIRSDGEISWHWCHLIAYSLIPTKSAQKKNNLICGTSVCNGQMINIETAIKRFVLTYKRPLGLEVMSQYYNNTHIATRIRYRIFDKKGSMMSHSEYFDALTVVKADLSEYEPIYNRMLNTFGEVS